MLCCTWILGFNVHVTAYMGHDMSKIEGHPPLWQKVNNVKRKFCSMINLRFFSAVCSENIENLAEVAFRLGSPLFFAGQRWYDHDTVDTSSFLHSSRWDVQPALWDVKNIRHTHLSTVKNKICLFFECTATVIVKTRWLTWLQCVMNSCIFHGSDWLTAVIQSILNWSSVKNLLRILVKIGRRRHGRVQRQEGYLAVSVWVRSENLKQCAMSLSTSG